MLNAMTFSMPWNAILSSFWHNKILMPAINNRFPWNLNFNFCRRYRHFFPFSLFNFSYSLTCLLFIFFLFFVCTFFSLQLSLIQFYAEILLFVAIFIFLLMPSNSDGTIDFRFGLRLRLGFYFDVTPSKNFINSIQLLRHTPFPPAVHF